MALTREAYKAIEDIVGPENISEEPAVLDGYAFQAFAELLVGSKFMPRPEAVVLPGSAEEVQAIVKACNRFKIKFKPFGTGWGVFGGCGSEGVVQMDLRRMNRILEIDEKNKYAVVEPYVTFGQLHHEAIKRGLRPITLGAGPNISVVAGHTSMEGGGATSVSAGYSARNILGVEWVLPTGVVLRLGTQGSGAGWFCADGPGPSLRGIMRGQFGAMGGLGVFTKCAVKLYSWAGPPEHRSKGNTPFYEPEIPENFRVYLISFPSSDKFYEAAYLIGEAEIAYGAGRYQPWFLGAMMSDSNQDFWELWQKGVLRELGANSFELVMAAHSNRELEYKEKCVREIIDKTGGMIVTELQENPRAVVASYLWHLWGGQVIRGFFRTSGGYFGSHYVHEAINAVKYELPSAIEEKKPFRNRGVIADEEHAAWSELFEHGAIGIDIDHGGGYDPRDPESLKAVGELMSLGHSGQVQRKTYEPHFGDQGNRMTGPANSNYHLWLLKIKKAFDPNTTADGFMYVIPTPEDG